MLRDDQGHWQLALASDKAIKKDGYLAALTNAPGDGHVTRQSQERFSPQEREAIAGAVYSIPARHRKIFDNRAALEQILKFLLD